MSHHSCIHLAAVGDPLYAIGGVPKLTLNPETGQLPVPGDCGDQLHAWQIGFLHPRTQQPLQIEAPPPELLRA